MKAEELTRIDANMLREPDIQVHGLQKFDDVYTFYYDETSNVRRLYIRDGTLNAPDVGCFALGGIAHRGAKRPLDLSALRSELRLQANITDIKFKHIAKGEFPDALRSRKLVTLFEWLSDQELLAHFFVMDPIYWAAVDIIDGVLMECGEPNLFAVHMPLKNDLYAALRLDRHSTIKLIGRFTLQDRAADGIKPLLSELIRIIEQCRDVLSDFNARMLIGVLKMGLRIDELSIRQDEISHVLIDRFGEFYAKRVCLFKNATHIFDAEDQVQSYFAKFSFVDGSEPLENFAFVPSEDEPGVQISDVCIGLIGRFYSFLNQWSADEIAEWSMNLTPIQEQNLLDFVALMDRSTEENEAFAHYVLSLEDLHRGGVIWR